MTNKKTWMGLLLFLFLIVVDQITKYAAYSSLRGKEPIVLVRGVLELQYLENRGAAFGILQNQRVLLVVITIAFLLFAVWFARKIPAKGSFRSIRFLLILLAAGAVGNMLDRIFRGYVVDFIYISLIHFPIFNVADCYVTAAVGIFLVLLMFRFSEDDLEELVSWKK